MTPEKLQLQDWIIRAALIVVITGFVLGWALRYLTRSGRAAAERAKAEEVAAIRCEKCGYYLVPKDEMCPKCGHAVAVSSA
jgi:hypothetical protein